MFEKFAGISIKGRCFDQEQILKFFSDSNSRLSLTYGANGSGKSTISQAFKILAGNGNNELSVQAIDLEGQTMEQQFSDIYVFDEEYIDHAVKLRPDGLDSIILLGDDVDVQQQIDEKKLLLEEAIKKCDRTKTEYEQFCDIKDPSSPQYHLNLIKSTLKRPDGWAERDSKIKRNKTSTAVSDSVACQIGAMVVEVSHEELQKEYEAVEQLFADTAELNPIYQQPIPTISIEINEKQILELLCISLEKPTMSRREERILALIQCGYQTRVEEAKRCFSNGEQAYCPFCFQTVSDAYKADIVQSIRNVLNEDADVHKSQLVKAHLMELSTDYSPYKGLNASIVAKLQESLAGYNAIVQAYNKAIEEKINNIYTPIQMGNLGLHDMLERMRSQILALENARQKYLQAAKHKSALEKRLIEINKQLAHFECEMIFQTYSQQLKKQKDINQAYEEQKSLVQRIASELKALENRKAKRELAVEQINRALAYVFFSDSRLKIELHEDRYYLKSRGKSVKPKDVSEGERNIIALCYFFYQIAENRDLTNMYAHEQLLVLDDPVSSFDFENKVGILSLLRREIKRIIWGNDRSKVLVLTHDLATSFDMQKAFDEIKNAVAHTQQTSHKIAPANIQWQELSQHELKSFPGRRSEYARLLEDIYRFASDNGYSDNGIGNKMRRALEAFSSFIYRKSIEEVSCDQGILNQMGDCADYFESRMYRIVLHSESHYLEQVQNFHDSENFYSFISEDEKRYTAQDVLCFIYLLNQQHIRSYLTDNAKVATLEKWCESIRDVSRPVKHNEPKKPHRSKVVKLYDMPLSAGSGISAIDEVDYVDYETNQQNCDLALRISGDSMEPDIPNGSLVLIHKQETLDNGKIGAFLYNGELFCKKRVVDESCVRLISLNPVYPPIEVQEMDDLICYGEVIKIIPKEN